MLKQRKGQMTLADAPTVVLLVGLVFLVMATIAFIGARYGTALQNNNLATSSTNESTGGINATGYVVDNASLLDAGNFVITDAWDTGSTGTTVQVPTTNLTISSAGVVTNATVTTYGSNATVSYTNTYSTSTTASNVTVDLNTEIANNTSIAGIVLTISLVGIVLTVLIGIFLVTKVGNRA